MTGNQAPPARVEGRRDRRAVFFDRDGTLCEDADYLNRWEDFKVLPDIASLKLLRDKHFKLIGITNQSGIARGIIKEEFVREVNRYFIDAQGFEDFYYCPHHQDEHCACRKPEPGMLLRAGVEHGVDLTRSYVVGDKEADMLLAKAVGAKGVLVLTGKQSGSPNAAFVARGLAEAVKYILSDI
ncbi:MAG: HAD family hydrolase [Nitrospirota bacterium]|jgi:heptosyltransferase-2